MIDIIDESIFLIFLLSLGFPFITLMFLVFNDMRSAKKSIGLYFESNKLLKMISIKVKDGMTQIKKKRFYVDTSSPPVMATGILVKSFRPVYIFKHDRAVPFKIVKKGVESERSPENLKNLIENKTLDQLLTPKTSGGMQLMFLIMGVVMGGLVVYALVMSKIIPIG